jgi:hypothetical protein
MRSLVNRALQMQLALVLLVLVMAAPQARAAGELRGNEQVASVIEQFILSGHADLSSQVDKERLFQIFTFYHDRDFKPIWTRDSGPKTKAKVLLKALKGRATMASTRPNTPSPTSRCASIRPTRRNWPSSTC